MATDKQGNTTWKAASEAFGAAGILQNQSSIEMNLRFPGQYFDQETGSHYNFHRDYRPNQGRYIQSDPLTIDAGINLFAYVDNKPQKAIDPLGLIRWDGAVYMVTIGFAKMGAGVSLLVAEFDLKTKCINGKQGTARVNAVAIILGAGKSAIPFGSYGFGTAWFEDGLSNVDPDVFNGHFSIASVGTAVYSITPVVLGGAVGDASGFGFSTDLFSAYGSVAGKSKVFARSIKDCCEK